MKNRSSSAALVLSVAAKCLPLLLLIVCCLPVSAAYAQAVAPAAPSFSEALSRMMPIILASFFVFYFMVIKPQNQKAQAQKTMMTSLTKGDTVVTTGGIIAKVGQIEGDVVTLEIAPQVRLRMQAEHIKQLFEEKKPEEKK